MKISIYNNDTEATRPVVQSLKQALAVFPEALILDDEHPDVVITVGGDGTLLNAMHHYEAQLATIRFVGVHTGHLGFYTDWTGEEVEELVAALLKDTNESMSYPLLEMTVNFVDGTQQKKLALNEVSLRRLEGTMVADVSIRDNFFERFRGDGFIISTPTGSTAYAKSNGGAVIHPTIEAIQLCEIASINNRVYRTLNSPMIIPKEAYFTLRLLSGDFMINYDTEALTFDRPVESLEFRVAQERINFAQYRHLHFWDRVQNAFINDDQQQAKD